ncbi:MAG TPA: hypothetical protein ENN69_03745 [Spirochaetia bacterium]|nr:hypothetical protein [Spirochaetia bacterium]
MQDQELQTFLQRVEKKTTTVRRRALLTTLIPVVVGAVLLVVISVQIGNATTELNNLQEQNAELKRQLRESIVYAKHVRPMDWTYSKHLASATPTIFSLFETIQKQQEQNVGWDARNLPPGQGFNSPGFAAYILKILGVSTPESATSNALSGFFPATETPQPGDLVFYESGFVMFYFETKTGDRFCIGMTPVGIVSLDLYFGPRLLGFGRVNY